MDKVTYSMDFSKALVDVPAAHRPRVLRQLANYGLEAILADVAETRSPVTGRLFKKLSHDYAVLKAKESSAPVANLELSGDMLDSLKYKISGTKVEWGIWGHEAPKADGHNNFSGKSKNPERKFIPNAKAGETFRPDIRQEMAAILTGAAAGVPSPFASKVR